MDRNGRISRRDFAEEKVAAVQMARTPRAQVGAHSGTAQRVNLQLGYGVESLRSLFGQASIDCAVASGVTSDGQAEIRRLEQKNCELKRANKILKRAASFLGAETCLPSATTVGDAVSSAEQHSLWEQNRRVCGVGISGKLQALRDCY